MTTKITLDQAGRMMLPKALRDELHLGPGDSLQLENIGERITLRPIRGTMPLKKEDGIWVFRIGEPLSAAATGAVIEDLRAQHDLKNTGKRK